MSKKRKKGFALYWHAYGGWDAFVSSPYFRLSFFLAAGVWVYKGFAHWDWYGPIMSMFPSLLGITLGGYAVFVSFSDNRYVRLLKEKDEGQEYSDYMEVNASFIHFIVVQAVSLLFATVANSFGLENRYLAFFGGFALFYSLCMVFCVAFALFTVAKIFDAIPEPEEDQEDGGGQCGCRCQSRRKAGCHQACRNRD